MRQRRKILFTTVWYPDRYDNMMGLFVRKHAAAVARDNDVSVVYTRPDVSVPLFSPLHLETNEYEGVHEYLLYYHASTLPVLRKAINLVFFLAAVFCLLRTAFRKEGRPDIIHVNVLTRWGVIAFLTKKSSTSPTSSPNTGHAICPRPLNTEGCCVDSRPNWLPNMPVR